MRILLVGTSTDPELHTSGFNLGYEAGFEYLDHDVTSIAHNQVPGHEGSYDFILLRDTTVNVMAMKQLAQSAKKFAVFTHAEFNQGHNELETLRDLDPDIIFLDQPLGGYVFKDLKIPQIFLGYGAHDDAWPAERKDIDVLWVGHGYTARQPEVKEQVWPLRELSGFDVRIHGNGQPDGPLSIPQMLRIMSRAHIVIHIGGPVVTDNGGYGGRRIYDALASGCLVVSTWSPLCKQIFPFGVLFCERTEVMGTVITVLNRGIDHPWYQDEIERAFFWAIRSQLISNKADAMLQAVGLEKA